MSFKRCTLHLNGLDLFKFWLTDIYGTTWRDGKGDYQVIQVMTEKFGFQVVFSSNNMKEHFSINEKLMSTVQKFYAWKKLQ